MIEQTVVDKVLERLDTAARAASTTMTGLSDAYVHKIYAEGVADAGLAVIFTVGAFCFYKLFKKGLILLQDYKTEDRGMVFCVMGGLVGTVATIVALTSAYSAVLELLTPQGVAVQRIIDAAMK